MKQTEQQTNGLIQALEAMVAASRESDSTLLAMRIDAARQNAETLLTEIKPSPFGVRINAEQELYVIPGDGGYSCLGFNVLMSRYKALTAWLRSEGLQADDLPFEARGSVRVYINYQRLMDRTRSYCQRNNLRCLVELTRQLTGLEGKRVEVVSQEGQRRCFIVGRSTGWMPIHLECRRDFNGGVAASGPYQSVVVLNR